MNKFKKQIFKHNKNNHIDYKLPILLYKLDELDST